MGHKQNKEVLFHPEYLGNNLKNELEVFKWKDSISFGIRKDSIQVLALLRQNGVTVNDDICEEWPDNSPRKKSANELRCMYEREKLLQRMRPRIKSISNDFVSDNLSEQPIEDKVNENADNLAPRAHSLCNAQNFKILVFLLVLLPVLLS